MTDTIEKGNSVGRIVEIADLRLRAHRVARHVAKTSAGTESGSGGTRRARLSQSAHENLIR
jgi:hypothetical protein